MHLLEPAERIVPMQRSKRGYFHARVPQVAAGALYRYRLNSDKERPDPASRLFRAIRGFVLPERGAHKK